MNKVLITGARAPVALHLARVFSAAGCEVAVADTLSRPLAASSNTISRYVKLPRPDRLPDEFLRALRRELEHFRPDLVVPTCEEVFYLAWAFEAGARGASLFAPPLAVLTRAHSKALLQADAAACGMATPATTLIDSREALACVRPLAKDLVFKPVWSRFATRVLIRPEPRALDAIVPTSESPWVAQEFMPGEEICCYALARDGALLGWAAYRPAHRAGAGAGVYYVPVRDDAIAAACQAYVSATRWTGQISFDFRRDAAGTLRVLECNPRATSGVFFFGARAGLARSFLDGARVEPDIDAPLMIPTAMWIYGLLDALAAGRFAAWRRDLAAARDALDWPGDRLPLTAQPLAMAELAGIALSERMSLLAASTAGIAWNGAPIGKPCTPAAVG